MSGERKFWGKFPGWCADNNDPQMVGRIRVRMPYPFDNDVSTWALPCLPPGVFQVPREGDPVWVEFVDGDANQPVWTGVWYAGAGTDPEAPTTAPFQGVHEALTDFEGTDVEPDREHAAAVDPTDHAEHEEFHNHTSEFYTPHQFVQRSHTGHHLKWHDHPGKEGGVQLFERFGRLLEMTARGITRLRSYLHPSSDPEPFLDLNGAPVDAAHRLTFADQFNDPADGEVAEGQFISLQDMAGAELRLESTPDDEHIKLVDFHGQQLRINTKNGEEYVELKDKAGQRLKMDPNAQTVRVDDDNGNYILMADGKITVFVPAGKTVHIGGESGQALATKTFVEQFYNTHTHLSSSPGTPTSPPVLRSPLTPSLDITKKQRSE